MKMQELQQKTKEELMRMHDTLVRELEEKRFLLKQGKQKNVREVRIFKKDIARVLTMLQKKNQPNFL